MSYKCFLTQAAVLHANSAQEGLREFGYQIVSHFGYILGSESSSTVRRYKSDSETVDTGGDTRVLASANVVSLDVTERAGHFGSIKGDRVCNKVY